MRKTNIASFFIVLLSFILAVFFFPKMPDMMAAHWNLQGQVDGYLPKTMGLFLMPSISLVILIFFLVIPKIDPLKKNVEKFRSYLDIFILVLLWFLIYIYLLSISWNLGIRFRMVRFLSPAFSVVLYFSGILMEKSQKNWFIGFRSPWTLSSNTVWEKTNKLAGKLFKSIAFICLLGIFFPDLAVFFILVPTVISVVFCFFYSYYIFKKPK